MGHDKPPQVEYNKSEMDIKLTPGAQRLINELAANGIKLQDLAPIVGLAAEFASAARADAIGAEYIEQAIRARDGGEYVPPRKGSKA